MKRFLFLVGLLATLAALGVAVLLLIERVTSRKPLKASMLWVADLRAMYRAGVSAAKAARPKETTTKK